VQTFLVQAHQEFHILALLALVLQQLVMVVVVVLVQMVVAQELVALAAQEYRVVAEESETQPQAVLTMQQVVQVAQDL
jgi:hypothetical protein